MASASFETSNCIVDPADLLSIPLALGGKQTLAVDSHQELFWHPQCRLGAWFVRHALGTGFAVTEDSEGEPADHDLRYPIRTAR